MQGSRGEQHRNIFLSRSYWGQEKTMCLQYMCFGGDVNPSCGGKDTYRFEWILKRFLSSTSKLTMRSLDPQGKDWVWLRQRKSCWRISVCVPRICKAVLGECWVIWWRDNARCVPSTGKTVRTELVPGHLRSKRNDLRTFVEQRIASCGFIGPVLCNRWHEASFKTIQDMHFVHDHMMTER